MKKLLTMWRQNHLTAHTSRQYDTAVGALQKLLDKRDAQRKEELWNAIIKSEKTYDEILTFITAGQTTEEE